MIRFFRALLVLLVVSVPLVADQLKVSAKQGFSPDLAMPVWTSYLEYEKTHSCRCFLFDFYQVNNSYAPVRDPSLQRHLMNEVAATLDKGEGEDHKVIILMFEYQSRLYVVIDLSLDPLHMSLGQREICASLYGKRGTEMMVFDSECQWLASFGD